MTLIDSNKANVAKAPHTLKLSAPLQNSNVSQQGLGQLDSFSNDGNGLDGQLTQFKRLAQNSGRSGNAIVFGGNHSDGKQAQHLKTWSLSTDSNGVNGYSNPPSDFDFRPEIKTRKVKRKRNQPAPETQAAPTSTPSKPQTTSKPYFKPEPVNRFEVLPKITPVVEQKATAQAEATAWQGPKECPEGPSGVSIDENIRMADDGWKNHRAGYGKAFYMKVRNGGPMDYKQMGKPKQYEAFGNFNYGAVGHAYGIPDKILLRAAGAAQALARDGKVDPKYGHPNSLPPYGDTYLDQTQIQAGIDYAKRRLGR